MFDTAYAIGGVILVSALLLVAILRAGPPEQIGTATVALGWIATPLIQRLSQSFAPASLFLVQDLLVLFVLVILTWKSRRDWPVMAAAFQAVGVAVHAAYLFEKDLDQTIYLTAIYISSLGVVGALIWGIWTAVMERRKSRL